MNAPIGVIPSAGAFEQNVTVRGSPSTKNWYRFSWASLPKVWVRKHEAMNHLQHMAAPI